MRFEPLGVLFGAICGLAGLVGLAWRFLHVPTKKEF